MCVAYAALTAAICLVNARRSGSAGVANASWRGCTARTAPPRPPLSRHLSVRSVCGATGGGSGGDGGDTAAAGLRALAAEAGVWMAPSITIAPAASHGLGLVCIQPTGRAPTPPPRDSQRRQAQQQEQGRVVCIPSARPLVRVPLDLVLSPSIPGCSPAANAAPELAPLLRGTPMRWELQLAGMLLWAAARGGPSSAPGRPTAGPGADAGRAAHGAAQLHRERCFWQRYSGALPSPGSATSLLLWSEGELAELQVAGLRGGGGASAAIDDCLARPGPLMCACGGVHGCTCMGVRACVQ